MKLSPAFPEVLEGISLHKPSPGLWSLMLALGSAGKGRALCSFLGRKGIVPEPLSSTSPRVSILSDPRKYFHFGHHFQGFLCFPVGDSHPELCSLLWEQRVQGLGGGNLKISPGDLPKRQSKATTWEESCRAAGWALLN